MVHAVSMDDAMQEVVGEALARTGQAEAATPGGLGLFDDLRREFPQATIMTVNLAALLEALDEAVECQDVWTPMPQLGQEGQARSRRRQECVPSLTLGRSRPFRCHQQNALPCPPFPQPVWKTLLPAPITPTPWVA